MGSEADVRRRLQLIERDDRLGRLPAAPEPWVRRAQEIPRLVQALEELDDEELRALPRSR